MNTIDKKIEEARKKREALVLAEAELMTQLADEEQKARRAELHDLMQTTMEKAGRLSSLRERLMYLIDESDQVMAREVAPAWAEVQKAAAEDLRVLEAFCAENKLPQPNPTNGFRALAQAAPWVPLPQMETTDPETGEVKTTAHPAYQDFGQAFMSAWHSENK